VGVDESRHDERAGVIVDDRALRRAFQNVARFADRLNQTTINERGSIFDERISARAAFRAGCR